MKIHLIQMTSTDDVETNLQSIESLVSHISDDCSNHTEPGLLCLPENALYMRVQEGEAIEGLTLKDPCFDRLRTLAKEKNCLIHVGSSPIQRPLNKVANASLLIHPTGEVEISYEKLHLFDMRLENGLHVRESDVFTQGLLPQVFHLNSWSFGQTICYDLRFSELYNFYARIPVDVILVPSSFLAHTGQAHWHVLLRARAIESQCYIIAAAQAGFHVSQKHPKLSPSKRQTYGHSLIIDPWGDIIAEGSKDTPQCLSLSLDKNRLESIRKQIPMKSHRRSYL
jgi:deaminated glutathione amidase